MRRYTEAYAIKEESNNLLVTYLLTETNDIEILYIEDEFNLDVTEEYQNNNELIEQIKDSVSEYL
jgi:hypothetical protein